MTPSPSRGIDVLVELAPLLGLAPIRLLLADVVLLLVLQHGLGGVLHQIAPWLPGQVVCCVVYTPLWWTGGNAS